MLNEYDGINLFLDGKILQRALTWEYGAKVKWKYDADGTNCRLLLVAATKDDPGLQLRCCSNGFYFRIPCPDGMGLSTITVN
jgi:hypothetical protein